jgi:hypothetical protein
LVGKARQIGYKGPNLAGRRPVGRRIIEIAVPLQKASLSAQHVCDCCKRGHQDFVKAYRAKWGDAVINGQTPIWNFLRRKACSKQLLRCWHDRRRDKGCDALRETVENYDAGLLRYSPVGRHGQSHNEGYTTKKFWITGKRTAGCHHCRPDSRKR